MLFAAHYIGLIKLDMKNPSESQITGGRFQLETWWIWHCNHWWFSSECAQLTPGTVMSAFS